MNQSDKFARLKAEVQDLYKARSGALLFHGWHHISFVLTKSLEFAKSLGADTLLVQSAALLHDTNYFFEKNSPPDVGHEFRESLLRNCGYSTPEIEKIEKIIFESHTAFRNADISVEGKALSDADTLFKALPITPILFSGKFIAENNMDIQTLAHKIITEQNKLMESGIYFYSKEAKEHYLEWASVNLKLWNCVIESLDDPSVQEMLAIAKDLGVL